MNTGLTELQMNILTQTCARYPEIERFVIFGSRAKGNYKPGADIDTFLTISLDWVEKA